ncbi:UDP-N-acetylmuramoyl-L-alanine--D-glutamate ligase [Legionella impletisoli]|uniref:UDP-N-acetylmuramoylalanine--D-glutamate ligase n=1 Tax=Legionella impletisoli TaxID=343510 RepID=A0A917NCR5_9GAMM|nr:UDP-N-acetylmuramoyl-L-alanine--D-glutamate ligase [Legionella impletisoli]GGI88719.1 UDP-N-acetylmuramoylalanine--D-glutamate ligase [Legionella impletisoli]
MHSALHLVVGLGQTGLSIARYLQRRHVPFAVFDTRKSPAGAAEFKVGFPGVDLYLEELPESMYERLNGIICSPGVPLDAPFLQKAKAQGIPILGDIDCLAREIKEPVIAITGTNGKSTVTTLVGEMTKASGLTVAVAGNIGLPVLDILDVGVHYDLWVLELSSFQLDLTHSLAPLASTILNITPDHLDRHHTFQAYVDSKQRIYNQAEVVLFNRDDKNTYPKVQDNPNLKIISFGSDSPDSDYNWGLIREADKVYLAKGRKRLIAVDQMRIRGVHNWMNALAASALADIAGVHEQSIVDVLERFAGLPHRSQWVRTLNEVDWINDSKATNVGATISAISGIGGSMQGKIVLIAGGQGKGADFNDLTQPIAEFVRTVVLIGQDADLIEDIIPDRVEVVRAGTMDDAVKKAKYHAKPGDVVLLSPACASFDMFRDFNHRGDDFMALVNAL